ncbi:nickel pincer cofactor biosynthesis protein LarC [Clostridium sp. DJ247]|uniref:nickel pincer cofactor biosynthesis protein LarC n=1 Tax=Clostridium sp. DJ247 TaxID=2726188 RepID=UPI001625BF2A|nr:nickel pincer cofactor biosynthesis protein LarC [Clostridium sp. DJ247]MBC2579908.1 nickel pincer cofactor biosynthesis protein LarC [Clostridium sp. DJ247]
MRILYYDCFSGISGDMNLGALIDLGVDKDYLVSELSKLNIDEYKIVIKKDVKRGIAGTKVDVILNSIIDNHKNHHHEHNHENQHKHALNHHKEHQHRNLKDIESLINLSSLSNNVKDISLKIFGKVAEAEAKVHNKSLEEVHFHEVGAVDSIIDIVGAAICFDYLDIHKVKCSTVEVGSGFVKCAHGVLPVPAPATSEILKNVPLKSNIPFEATTPTGAAILSYLVDEFTDKKNFKVEKIGYGIGNKDEGDTPNVLRVFLAEENESSDNKSIETAMGLDTVEDFVEDEVYIIECNIDDMNPELYEYIIEILLKQGALDVYLTPIIMKKGRPGVKLSVLYHSDKEHIIKELILTETTTLGIRKYKAQRSMLKRKFEKVTTIYGEFTVKSAYYNGKRIKCKAEYDECKKVALENNVNINKIYREIWDKI